MLRRIESTNTLWRSWARRAVIYEDREDPVAATLWLLRELGVAGGRVALEEDSFFVTPRRHAELVAGIERSRGSTIAGQPVVRRRPVAAADRRSAHDEATFSIATQLHAA